MNADARAASSGTSPPAPAGLPDGYRIGSFELQSVWQRSATAVVYRAWDHALVRPVALKEYLPAAWALREPDGEVRAVSPGTAAAFERGRQAFIDEARTLARCDHPSLLRVYELLETGGTAWRVMPWYTGLALQEVRRRTAGPFGEPALRGLLDKLLGALHAYQRAGGVHRGVNPAQVLLLEDDQVLLLGPGAAGTAAQAGEAGMSARRRESAYAPPEQTHPKGQPQGPWTDFYALAALARFCITGLPLPPPAAVSTTPEPLAAAIETLFPGQPAVRYADELLRALDAAMAHDISQRPQTAAQFRERVLGAPQAAPVAPVAPVALVTWAAPGAPSADSFHAVDPAMQNAIRHVIDSIDAPPEPASDAAAGPARWQADPAERIGLHGDLGIKPRKTGRSRTLLQAGIALVVVVGLGFSTLDFIGPHWPPMAMLRVPVLSPSEDAAPPPPPVAAAPQNAPVAVIAAAAPSPPVLALPAPPPAKAAIAPAAARAATGSPASPTSPVPPAPTAPPAAKANAPAGTPTTPTTGPRQACGARSAFSLYRCMQQQCDLAKWRQHGQCLQFEATDRVD